VIPVSLLWRWEMERRSPGEREGSSHAALLIRTSCGQPQSCSMKTQKSIYALSYTRLSDKSLDMSISFLLQGWAAKILQTAKQILCFFTKRNPV